jgi:nucleotide-binding universal stress UspA family protein
MIAWARIVCAVDFSDASRAALEHAAELARRFHAELVLVHVSTGPVTEAAPPLPLTDEEEAELQRRLEAWERDAEQIAGRDVRTVLASGAPAPEIARVAAEVRADLVVTGTHGRSGLERAVLGSVAVEVVRSAPCATLVVRGPRDWAD